ncbi:MAG TPA: hypothetical protein VHJ79_06220, partial [Mycobacterium sp.]|nr:hypothetical protein [Mycobacterium sp.]
MVLIAALLDALIRAYRLSKKHTLDELAALSWQQSEEAIADAFVATGTCTQIQPSTVEGSPTRPLQIDPSAHWLRRGLPRRSMAMRALGLMPSLLTRR